MSHAALAVTTILPSLLFLRCFYARDHYASPPRGLWATFVLGMTLFVPILVAAPFVREWLSGIESPLLRQLAESFWLAAFPEELLKWLILAGFSVRLGTLRGPLDGILYGAAASLGFATVENALYVAAGGPTTAFLRAFTAVPCHAMLGVLMGYAAGRAVIAKGRFPWAAWWGGALVVPVAMHTIYDFPLFTLGGIFEGTIVLEGDSLALVAVLVAGFLVNLVGGLAAAFALANRARERVSLALDTRGSTGAPRDDTERSREFAPPRRGAPLMALGGILLAGAGGWLLVSLIDFLASPGSAGAELAAPAIVILLVGGAALAYGLRFSAGVLRSRRGKSPWREDFLA